VPSHSPEAPSGNTRDEAIAAARAEYGPGVRIRGVRRIRSGGVAGFFSQERYVADVVLPGAGEDDARVPVTGGEPAGGKPAGGKPAGGKPAVAAARPKVAPARSATPTVVAELPRTAGAPAAETDGWPSSGLSVDDLLEVALQVRGAQRTAATAAPAPVDPVDELAELLGPGGSDVAVYSPTSVARPAGKARPASTPQPAPAPAAPQPERRPLATRRAEEPVEPAAPAWERTSRSGRPTADPAVEPEVDSDAGGAPPSPFAAALMRVVTQDDEVQAAVADAEEHEEQRVAAEQHDVASRTDSGALDDRAAAVRAAAERAEAAAVAAARAGTTPPIAVAALTAAPEALEAPAAPVRSPEERRAAARARAAARRSARPGPAASEPSTPEVPVAAPTAAPEPMWDATSIIELAPRAGMPAAAQRPPAPAVTRVTAARAGAAQLREAAIRAAGELAERQVAEVGPAPDLLDDFVDADLAAQRPAQPAQSALPAQPSLGDRAARLRSVLAAATPPADQPAADLPVLAEAAPARRTLPAVAPSAPVDTARHEAERLEAERVEALRVEAQRIEDERLETLRIEAERMETERAAAQAEVRRVAAEQAQARRAAAQAAAAEAARTEARRIQSELAEARRVAAEQAAAEDARAEAERTAAAEARRAVAEKAATGRAAALRTAAEKAAAQRAEDQRRAAAQAEADRLAAERAERTAAERAAATQRAAVEEERAAAERAAREAAQAEAAQAEAAEVEAAAIEAAQVGTELPSPAVGDSSEIGRRRTRAERREAAERARAAGTVHRVDAPAQDDVPAPVEIDPLWGTPVRRPLPVPSVMPDGGRHSTATGLQPAVTAAAADDTAPVVDEPRPIYSAGSRYDEVLFGASRGASRTGQPDPLEALRAAALAGGAVTGRRRRAEEAGRHRTLPTQVDLPVVGAARLTALDDPAEATSGFIESLQAVADSEFAEAPAQAAEVSDVLVQEMAHEMAAGMAEELARTASDPSPVADATSVLASLSAVLPAAAPRVRGQRPPVPAGSATRSRVLPPHPSTRMRGTRVDAVDAVDAGGAGQGWATITHLNRGTDGPAEGGPAGLAALGVPPSVLGADFAAEASRRGTFAALASALGRALPAAPAIPSEPGDVLVVVGPGAEALGAARALAVALRLDPSRVLWCTRGPLAGLAAADAQISGAAAATEVRALLTGSDVPTVVAVDVPLGDAGGARAAQMVQAWDAPAVWGVLDSTRKPAALRSWLAGLPRVDAVVVTDTDSAPDPAALLEGLPVPVAVVDGARATPHRWAALLCERLAGRR
ncbi:Hypothetical protein KLENKIAIHU_1274, partial [Klenkia terrae]